MLDRFNLVKHILAVYAGLLVLYWALYFMVSPLKYALGTLLFLAAVVVGEILLSQGQGNQHVVSQSAHASLARRIIRELVISCLFALSLSVVYFVTPIERKILVEWSRGFRRYIKYVKGIPSE